MVEMSIIESKRRLEFLEGELKKLEIKNRSNSEINNAAASQVAQTTLDADETRLDFLRYDGNITPAKVAYRLRETSIKLDFESRVKAGSENMLNALVKTPEIDDKRKAELETQLQLSKA